MKKVMVLLATALFAFGAQAQTYKWVDKDGKVRYGDVPPPGAKATSIRAPSGGTPEPPPAAAADKSAKKGPLTPAEREQEFRKRREEAAKASADAERERKEKESKQENCQRAREYLRGLESGQRITRVDAKGERYFLDGAQRDQETARAQQSVQEACK
jgi:hypothetical protein